MVEASKQFVIGSTVLVHMNSRLLLTTRTPGCIVRRGTDGEIRRARARGKSRDIVWSLFPKSSDVLLFGLSWTM